MPPMVSVIVPVYNAEAYLNRCAASILAQTFSDLELILVNDGSTDSSGSLCDALARQDHRIRVIHKPNGGPGTARNAGIEAATGRYLYFVDSDDYIEPVLLSRTIGLMEETGCDWCGFGAVKEDPAGAAVGQVCFKPRELAIGPELPRMTFLLKYLLSYRMGWEVCFHVFRSSIIREHQLRFVSERKAIGEDLLFSFQYWLYASRCVVIEDQLYHYVQHPGSLMDHSRSENILPRIHRLAEAAYQALDAGHDRDIRENFDILYLHLLEWHCRPYLAEYGADWVRRELKKLPQAAFSPAHTPASYQALVKKYGSDAGFVTLVLPLRTEEERCQAPDFIRMLSGQTLQKLDILILTTEAFQYQGSLPCVRVLRLDSLGRKELLQAGFREAYGEYLYFADCTRPLSPDFLETAADRLKYNNCGTLIPCGEAPAFRDMNGPEARFRMRRLLRAADTMEGILLRADLLARSGLASLDDPEKYWEEILLSDHIMTIPKE